MAKTVLRTAIIKAIESDDAPYFGRIADYLRFKGGMTYNESYDFVNSVRPITKDDYEDLLYRSEHSENLSN